MAWLVANAEMQILRGDCSVSRELSERVVECKLSGKAPPPLYCKKVGRYRCTLLLPIVQIISTSL